MKLGYRIWIETDDKAFGVGTYELLKFIEKTGSLSQGAADMKVSYRKAWNIIHKAEEKLGIPLLDRTVGGAAGGGSKLTPQAEEFMKRYEMFHAEAKQSLKTLFEKYFVQENSKKKTLD